MIAYLTFTFILVVTPGSTTAVVVRNALEGGRRAGFVTAAGAAFGNTIIATACGLGIAVLLAYGPGSLDAIRIGGAGFLAWLGVSSLSRAWRHADGGIQMNRASRPGAPRSHTGAYFGDGLTINLLSPVIISFYLSVVPTFIPSGAPRGYYAMLAAVHVTMAFVVHLTWAVGLAATRRLFHADWTRRTLQALTGLALIALAVQVITRA